MLARALAAISLFPGCGEAKGTSPEAVRGLWFMQGLGIVLAQPSSREIIAIDAVTGEPRWRFDRPPRPPPLPYALVVPRSLECPPQLTPSNQIILRYHEGIYSIDATTGHLSWFRILGPPATCAAVTPDSGAAVLALRSKALMKYDSHGQLLWRVRLPNDAEAVGSPQTLLPSGDVIVRTGNHVMSFNPAGKLNWERPLR